MKIKEDKFSKLIENIQDGYAYHQIVRDRSGKPVDCIFIDVNPAFESITGLSRIDTLGKAFSEVMPGIKESDLNWINIYKQLAYTEKPIQFESFSKPLNRWLEISAFSPEEGYFAAVFQDITERKRIKETLIVSETRYRRLFESAKDGILILDAESGKITDANPFLLELLGFSKEEILGKPIWEIGTFKDVVENQDNFLELQQKEYIRYEDLPLQTAKGRLIAVEFISNVYLENQHKVIQCNIRDITERKRTELFQNLSGKVLAILNKPGDFYDAIKRILSIIKSETGFDAIGMRLQNGEDFPYYTQYGFSNDFLSTEKSLTISDPRGDICRNADGSIRLDCTCGLVISGEINPSDPLFTPGGSSLVYL